MSINYFGKSFSFDKLKEKFITTFITTNKNRIYTDEQLVKLKVCPAHPRLVFGTSMFGYWEDCDWPVFNGNCRVIPHMPTCAVSKDGVVIDTLTGKRKTLQRNGSKKYLSFRGTVKGTSTNVPLHRQIGYCWVKNDDVRKYWLVRHLNDKVDDFSLPNLAWGDDKLNRKDAMENGSFDHRLKAVLAKRPGDDKPTRFKSISDFCRHVKSTTSAFSRHTLLYPDKLFKGTWEVKVGDIATISKEKWKRTGTELTTSKYLLSHKGKSYTTIAEAFKTNGVKYTTGAKPLMLLRRFLRETGEPLEISRNLGSGFWYEFTLTDACGNVTKFKNQNDVAEFLSCTKTMVRMTVVKGSKIKGYSVDMVLKPWTDPTVRKLPAKQNKPIKLTRSDGKSETYTSIGKAAASTSFGKDFIRARLMDGKIRSGVSFTYV